MQSTLRTLRRQIERLATDGGEYRVVCARTGTVPVDGLRFPDDVSASLAVALCRAYRRAFRRRDPRAPTYELVAEAVPEASDLGPPIRPIPSRRRSL